MKMSSKKQLYSVIDVLNMMDLNTEANKKGWYTLINVF